MNKKELEQLIENKIKSILKESSNGDLDLNDVKHYFKEEPSVNYASRYGSGFNKQFNISVFGNFIVSNHNKIVYKGKSVEKAVEVYNKS